MSRLKLAVACSILTVLGLGLRFEAEAGVAYVSGSGDDGSGTGAAAAPYRSFTHALNNHAGLTAIYAEDGTYDAANGEVFPLTIPDGIQVVAMDGAEPVLDPNYATNALMLAAGASGNLIEGLRIERAKGPAIEAGSWEGTIRDCTVTDTADSTSMANDDTAILFHAGEDSRTITLDGLVVTNVTTADRHLIYFKGGPNGTVVMTNCVFRDITITTAIGDRKGGPIATKGTSYNTGYTVTIIDCLFEDLLCAGQQYEETSYVDCWFKPLTVDRCSFLNVDANSGGNRMNLVGANRNSLTVQNSLFADCDAGTSRACIGGFRNATTIRNCTFDTVAAPFRPTGGDSYPMAAYNCLVTHSTNLCPEDGAYLTLHNVNIYDTPDGDGYAEAGSSDVTGFEPYYVDRDGGDYHLRTFSPLIDSGDNANAQGNSDLAGETRILDGDVDSTATVDLGAYEVNFLAPAASRFSTDKPTYAMFGGARSIPVFMNPHAGGAVDSAVAYGTNLSGGATLSFATGSTTSALNFTVSQPLTVANGTLSVITLTETNTSQGVESGEIGLFLYDGVVTINTDTRQLVRAGTTNTIRVELPDPTLEAPEELPIAVGTVGGSGNNQITWVGGGSIPNGGWQSAGYLEIVGGSGANTVELSIGGGFNFQETGDSNLTVTVVGYTSPLYVSTTGSDTVGDGTLANPFATITYAGSLVAVGDEIRLFPGTYSAVSGETFPISPGAVDIVATSTNPADTLVDGAGTADILFQYYAEGTAVTGSLRNLTFIDQAKNAVFLDSSALVLSNCVFRDTSVGNNTSTGDPVGAFVRNNSRVTASDCIFSNLTARGILGIEQATANTDNRITAAGCSFVDNNLSVGSFYAESGMDGHYWISDCLFLSNSLPTGLLHDAGPSPILYNWAGSTTEGAQILEMDRCRVIGNVSANVLGANRMKRCRIRNCLFVGNSTSQGFYRGYSSGAEFNNCTFSGNNGYFDGDKGLSSVGVNLYNCIVEEHGGAIGSATYGAFVELHDTIVWNSSLGTYDTVNSANVITGSDPNLNDDYSVRGGSPPIDAGQNGWMTEATDILGGDRFLDGDLNGTTNIDLGCFEYDFYGTTESTFAVPAPSYSVFEGQSYTLPVWINPLPGGAVDAHVAYPSDLSGTNLLSYATGTETNDLDYVVASPLSVPSATPVTLTLSETNTSLGVQPTEVTIYLYESKVVLDPSVTRFFVKIGETNTVRVKLEDESLGAPTDLTITDGAVGGTGNNQVTWLGGTTITNGGLQTAGYLRIIGGTGANTIQLTVDNGFSFRESDAASVTIEVMGASSPLYVATSGSDATGDGSFGNPLGTITYAASLLDSGDEVRLFAGTYGTNTGEVFPLVPGTIDVVGIGSAPGDCIIDGDSDPDALFDYTALGVSETGSLQGLTLIGQTKFAVLIDASAVVLSNCVFRDTTVGQDQSTGDPAACILRNDSRLTAIECLFTNLTGRGVLGVDTFNQNDDNRIVVDGCTFVDNYVTVGSLYAESGTEGRFWISDTLFANNEVPNDSVHDAYPSPVAYIYSGSQVAGAAVFEMDRCIVSGNSGGNVIGISRTNRGRVRNSLFVDNSVDMGFVRGYVHGLDFFNCTFSGNEGTFVGKHPVKGINLYNCIVAEHTGDLGDADGTEGQYLELHSTMTWNATLGTYDSGASQNVYTGVDPLLTDDYHLFGESSPATDLGNNAWMSEDVDLAGNPRLIRANVDLGAYEVGPAGAMFRFR